MEITLLTLGTVTSEHNNYILPSNTTFVEQACCFGASNDLQPTRGHSLTNEVFS